VEGAGACAPIASPVASALIVFLLFKLRLSPAVGRALDIAILLLMRFSVSWLSLWSLNAARNGAWRFSRRVSRDPRFGQGLSRH
jgi:hypothetical protein